MNPLIEEINLFIKGNIEQIKASMTDEEFETYLYNNFEDEAPNVFTFLDFGGNWRYFNPDLQELRQEITYVV